MRYESQSQSNKIFDKKCSQRILALLVMLCAAATVDHCGVREEEKVGKGPLKVAFITVGPVADAGYNYSHELSRQAVAKIFGDKISTSLVEKIPESADVERVMERLIADDNSVIFATSFGYLEPSLRVAALHPKTIFMHCGGFKASKNLGTYFAYLDEPFYLAGIVAGSKTSTGKLGFVAAHPIPNVLREINAFTLGAQTKRPDVQVSVVWTNGWSDPAKEVQAANALADAGADVLAAHQDSPIPVVQAAEARGLFAVGCHADASRFAPKGWLTGAEWSWTPIVEKVARAALAGTWRSEMIRGGLREGFVKLSTFGPSVPENLQNEVRAVERDLMSGKRSVFSGPMRDRDGNVRIPAGGTASFEMLESMDWLVQGVRGDLSK